MFASSLTCAAWLRPKREGGLLPPPSLSNPWPPHSLQHNQYRSCVHIEGLSQQEERSSSRSSYRSFVHLAEKVFLEGAAMPWLAVEADVQSA